MQRILPRMLGLCSLSWVIAASGCAPAEAPIEVDNHAVAQLGQGLATPIFAADFEGGVQPFAVSGVCYASSAARRSGAAGLRCDDSASITVDIATAGYRNISLSYARSTARYDAGEALFVEVSYAGQPFQTLDTVTGTSSYGDRTWNLDPQADDGQVRLRFRATANGFYEYFDVDDVVVHGEAAALDDSCDGHDDDGDGNVDEDFVEQPSQCGVGACAAVGLISCQSGSPVDSCQPGAPAPDDATCDGIDDDCDGGFDEDCATTLVTLLSEDFEAGAGVFSATGACIQSAAAASQGNVGMRCDDTAALETTLSTVGTSALSLTYTRRSERYDSGEYFFAEVSLDGSSWTVLEQVGVSALAQVSFPIDAMFADQDVVHLRFRSNANGFYERFDLDDVRVTGEADPHNEFRMLPGASDFLSMPWPSDHRRNPDGTLQLTGFPGLGSGQGGLGPMLQGNIEPAIHGFGTTTGVFFTMQGALDPTRLPDPNAFAADDAPVMLVNLDDPSSGRVPVLLDMKGAATLSRPGRLLTVMPYPGFNLEPDATYAAILFDNLQGRAGAVSRAALLDQLAGNQQAGSGLDPASFATLRAQLQQVEAYVSGYTSHGPSEVVAFAVYTTQPIGGEFDAMVETIAALDDAEILSRVSDVQVVRSCAACASDVDCLAAELDVTLAVPLFQTAPDFAIDLTCFALDNPGCMSTSGGEIIVGSDGRAQVQQWQTGVTMRVKLPCLQNQPTDGWPAIVYADGTGGSSTGGANRAEWFYWSTPNGTGAGNLSLNHVVGAIAPHQTSPRRDPVFTDKIDDFYYALTNGTGTTLDLNGFTYAFEFNPIFARNNNLQNAIDSLYVKRALLLLEEASFQAGVTPADIGRPSGAFSIDAGRTSLVGQSQGSHSAPIVLSVSPARGGFHHAYLNASGGDLFFERAAHRADMRPLMEGLFKLLPGEIDRFHPLSHLLQTAKDAGASLNYASRNATPGHVLITNGYQDGCSLRESTSAVATALYRTGAIEAADTAPAFTQVGLPVPPFAGIETVLGGALRPFGAGISGNLGSRTRLFLMLEGFHGGSGSGQAVGHFLSELGQGVTPTVIPPPYADGSSYFHCTGPRIE